jgi:hypothetical protein
MWECGVEVLMRRPVSARLVQRPVILIIILCRSKKSVIDK